jgi:hypothetical protein
MATNFKLKPPEEILKPDSMERHKAEMAYFHNKLSELHHSALFIQHIVDFPFDLFVHPTEDFFLRMVLDNLAQVAILQLTKLTTDNGPDARTIKKFKNFMDRAVKDEYRDDYRKLLGQARFEPRIDGLIDKAKGLRDMQIAHYVKDEMEAITFDEIKEIIREVTNLFEVASFDTEYRYLIFSYDSDVRSPGDIDARPDIERVLDGIARESPVLHEPERMCVGKLIDVKSPIPERRR